MTEDLDHLWALHHLDEQLLAIGAELVRFPAERNTVEQRLAADRVHLEALKSRLAELQLGRRKVEREVEVLSEQERKFQGQLPAVKKNEEYTALLHEIAGSKAKRSELETTVLTQMDEEEKVQRERPMVEQALKTAERDAEARLEKLAADERAHRERMAAIEAERAAHIEKISASVRSRYERIRVSREGRAVVPILKGACGGCFRAQAPQVMQEAKRRDRPLACDGCGRLLILPPDAS